MNLTALSKATYIALETFRKNGEGVITPVWVVGENDKLYVWTNLESWKVKRIRNKGRVRICESDSRGNPKSEWGEAQARVLDSDDAIQMAQSRFKTKYGIQFHMFRFTGRKSPKAIIEIYNQA